MSITENSNHSLPETNPSGTRTFSFYAPHTREHKEAEIPADEQGAQAAIDKIIEEHGGLIFY